ncbi:MAG: 4Fe-4S dicluster domain-containing protein [Acidobacteriota bacterium]
MTVTGFFTDSTLCIGCKACEVACKEWNEVPGDGFSFSGMSYDNTVTLSASTWRHVKFVEGEPIIGTGGNGGAEMTWEFSSDVCKHCGVAGCLEACPTGAIIRTEFGGVFIQPDICNGCGYCVVACPFGVVSKREDDGRVFKCTFCYDRQIAGLVPACAKACPTESIRFGELDTLLEIADARIEHLLSSGMTDATLYNPTDSSVGGIHAFFLLRGDPRSYNLPPDPQVPTTLLAAGWKSAAATAGVILAGSLLAFVLGGSE